jgi:hypothetical protein
MDTLYQIQRHYRTLFFAELTESMVDYYYPLTGLIPDSIKQKASAWYMTVFEQEDYTERTLIMESTSGKGTERLLSFPWILYDVLCNIMYHNRSGV